MTDRHPDRPLSASSISRRAVLRGAAAGAALVAGGSVARAAERVAAPPVGTPSYVPRPNRTEYAFRVGATAINPDNAAPVTGLLVNGTMPGPEIRVHEGDQLRVLVENGLDVPTTIHWHGLLVPAGMDGVPDVSNAPIAPGRTYVYEFPILQTGTYWYHSHYGFQEQRGLSGAFIVEPARQSLRAEPEAVVLLSDWLHRDPSEAFATLRAASGDMGSMQPKVGVAPPTPMAGMKPMAPMANKPAMGAMAPGAVDLSDLTYDAFLLNGRAAADPWTLAVRPGERMRLRVINGGTSTYFRLRLDDQQLRVTHADGLAVEPVDVDHILMGMGETYDVAVTLPRAGSYTLHAVAQDGSGQAIAVLHTPDVAPRPNRALPSFDGRGLTYADLRAPSATTLPPGAVRSFRLPLQGTMKGYVWMIDGQVFDKADPLRIRRGDRVQIEMVNETAMFHPMHLHGHFFRVLQGAGDRCPLKHTVNVAPGETVRIEFTADNPGQWLFHCHNTYHFEAGMGRVFAYDA